ncbi:tetratricopeptide repeat protein [Pyxidicoccus parkwayensis]|uniref:Tetratricopeptide repeat protein n=1 Tax=Pyxidicoccus parkwayensis TaxID=2813578 RepID=A0ABX7NQE1_9BACT|nr:tetratricopeptide repeat protein [Pyxidicoccus parkwaysis]QSQ21074.1 tetratricopeptide repeat protein [Pyxidicoccus parkwaysis]
MRLLPGIIVLVSLACTAPQTPATTAAATAPQAEPRYVVGLLPLQVTSPEAAPYAPLQEQRIQTALQELAANTPMTVVFPLNTRPLTSMEEARTRAAAAKVNTLVWGTVSAEGEKVIVKLSSYESTVDANSSFWAMEYSTLDPKADEQFELDALRIAQAIMQDSLLPMMMRDQPSNVRVMLEALVSKAPHDWVDWNQDIIRRRWGMLGRLLRDGALTEKGYRGALADVAAWRANHEATPSTNVKEAFYSVGLARGFLLQGKPQAAVETLEPIVKRMPEDVESRLLLARAHLAMGDTTQAPVLLQPLVDEGKNPAATRMYVAALAPTNSGKEQVDTALSRLTEKNPDDVMAALLRYLTAPGAARVEELKAFTSAHASADWPLPVARYFTGALNEQALWAATKDEDSHMERIHRIQVHYYLGEAALAGRLPGHEGHPDQRAAQQHFEAAIATHAFHHPTYDLADFQLEQLHRGHVASGR